MAVPHTESALGQKLKRVSLLYTPQEAANLDREAVFEIGGAWNLVFTYIPCKLFSLGLMLNLLKSL